MDNLFFCCFSALPPWGLSKCAVWHWSEGFHWKLFVKSCCARRLYFPRSKSINVSHTSASKWQPLTVWSHVLSKQTHINSYTEGCNDLHWHDVPTANPQSTKPPRGKIIPLNDELHALFWSYKKKNLLYLLPRHRCHGSLFSSSNSKHPLVPHSPSKNWPDWLWKSSSIWNTMKCLQQVLLNLCRHWYASCLAIKTYI